MPCVSMNVYKITASTRSVHLCTCNVSSTELHEVSKLFVEKQNDFFKVIDMELDNSVSLKMFTVECMSIIVDYNFTEELVKYWHAIHSKYHSLYEEKK